MITLHAIHATEYTNHAVEFDGEWRMTTLRADDSKWNSYVWDGNRIAHLTIGGDYIMTVDNGRNGKYDFSKHWKNITSYSYDVRFISADWAVHYSSIRNIGGKRQVIVTLAHECGRTVQCCVSPYYGSANQTACINVDRTMVYMTNIVETEELPSYHTVDVPKGDIVAMTDNYGGIWAFGRHGNVFLKDAREPHLNQVTPFNYVHVGSCGYATDGVITTVVNVEFSKQIRLFDVRNMKQYRLDSGMPYIPKNYILTAVH